MLPVLLSVADETKFRLKIKSKEHFETASSVLSFHLISSTLWPRLFRRKLTPLRLEAPPTVPKTRESSRKQAALQTGQGGGGRMGGVGVGDLQWHRQFRWD